MKSMIKNALGDRVLTSYVPCTSANAQTLCETLLEGTWSVFELASESGTDNATQAYDAQIQFRNSGTGKKGYWRGIVKSTISADDIQDTFMGKTLNGILVDEVVIISYAGMAFS